MTKAEKYLRSKEDFFCAECGISLKEDMLKKIAIRFVFSKKQISYRKYCSDKCQKEHSAEYSEEKIEAYQNELKKKIIMDYYKNGVSNESDILKYKKLISNN